MEGEDVGWFMLSREERCSKVVKYLAILKWSSHLLTSVWFDCHHKYPYSLYNLTRISYLLNDVVETGNCLQCYSTLYVHF